MLTKDKELEEEWHDMWIKSHDLPEHEIELLIIDSVDTFDGRSTCQKKLLLGWEFLSLRTYRYDVQH